MVSKCELVQIDTFVLSSSQGDTFSCLCLDSGKTEISPLGSLPHRKCISVFFAPQGEAKNS